MRARDRSPRFIVKADAISVANLKLETIVDGQCGGLITPAGTRASPDRQNKLPDDAMRFEKFLRFAGLFERECLGDVHFHHAFVDEGRNFSKLRSVHLREYEGVGHARS